MPKNYQGAPEVDINETISIQDVNLYQNLNNFDVFGGENLSRQPFNFNTSNSIDLKSKNKTLLNDDSDSTSQHSPQGVSKLQNTN